MTRRPAIEFVSLRFLPSFFKEASNLEDMINSFLVLFTDGEGGLLNAYTSLNGFACALSNLWQPKFQVSRLVVFWVVKSHKLVTPFFRHSENPGTVFRGLVYQCKHQAGLAKNFDRINIFRSAK